MTGQPTVEVHYRNGLGIAALVLGIVALAFSFIPIVNYGSVVMGVVGFVLAIVGLVRVKRGGANNPVVTVIGGLLSVIAVVVSFVVFAAFASAVDEGVQQFDNYMACTDAIEFGDPQFSKKMNECDAKFGG